MTRWWLFLSHIRRMAVSAVSSLLELLELCFDRHGLWVSGPFAVAMTTCTSINRNIGSQSAECAGARDVDVASGTFHHVLALTSLVREFDRNTFRRGHRNERRGGRVTAGAIIGRRFLSFPMTRKTGVMSMRPGFERA